MSRGGCVGKNPRDRPLLAHRSASAYPVCSVHPLTLGGLRARELLDGLKDSFPDRAALKVARGEQIIDTLSGDHGRIIAMALDQKAGSAPDIDIIDHECCGAEIGKKDSSSLVGSSGVRRTSEGAGNS